MVTSGPDEREPRVTVVVTCYNRERFLGAAIESVLSSRYRYFELLVLDDASTDRSVEIARGYAERDARLRVVVNETNLGDYPNRNRAIELARTEFLKYHDSDDLMYPHCLETMVPLLEAEPSADFGLSVGRAWSGGPTPMLLTPRMAYLREFHGPGMFFGGPSSALFRTESLRRLGGFPDYGPASDYCFWVRACSVCNVVLLPGDLFWYRSHPGQEISKPGAQVHYARAMALTWEALHSKECPLSGAELTAAKRSFVRRLLKSSWNDLRAGRFRLILSTYGRGGFPISDFLRYPPLKLNDPKAGTPLDEDGYATVPRWLRLD